MRKTLMAIRCAIAAGSALSAGADENGPNSVLVPAARENTVRTVLAGAGSAVEFSIGREPEPTATEAADLAVKLRNAGYAADHSMADPRDFARIGYALKNYNDIALLPDNQGYRSKDNGPAKQVEFRTRIDGTMAVQTVVPDTKRRTLFITSTRIEKAKG